MNLTKFFLQPLLRAAENVFRRTQMQSPVADPSPASCALPAADEHRPMPQTIVAVTTIAAFDADSALHRLRENPALLKHLIVAFLEDLPGELDEIRHAIDTADTAAVRAASHRLKGAAMTLSADPVMQAAAALERLATCESVAAKGEDMQAALRALQARASELETELRAYLRS